MSHMAESNENLLQYPSNQQLRNSLNGPVGVFWDIENCHVPRGVRPEDVGGNITMALRAHPIIGRPVITLSAYGDFSTFTERLREAFQRTGVKLVDVPNGRKDAADKAILLDMVLFACDNDIPSSIMLISGDVDFAPTLHTLGRRGHTVILAIPAGVGVSCALSNAAKFVWHWPSIARGEGYLPFSKDLVPHVEVAECLTRSYIKDNLGGENEEDTYYGLRLQNYRNDMASAYYSQSPSEYVHVSRYEPYFQIDCRRPPILAFGLNNDSAGPMSSSDQNEYPPWGLQNEWPPRVHQNEYPPWGLPWGLQNERPPWGLQNECPLRVHQNEYPPWGLQNEGLQNEGLQNECPPRVHQNEYPRWVGPGNLKGLSDQMVKLIELSDGRLPLTRVQAEYRKHFGTPLDVSEYGAVKLVNLFKKMGDTLAVEGSGHTKFVCLRNRKAGPSATPMNQAKNDKKGKGVQEENVDLTAGCSSGDTYGK